MADIEAAMASCAWKNHLVKCDSSQPSKTEELKQSVHAFFPVTSLYYANQGLHI